MEGYALEGLRTLMVGVKNFSNEEYERWDEVRSQQDFRLVAVGTKRPRFVVLEGR